MKNYRKPIIIICLIVAISVGIYFLLPRTSSGEGLGNSSVAIDLSQVDTSKPIEAMPMNGNIADHVKGNLKTAKVVLYEYGDYQCSGCATINPWAKKLLEEYGEDLAIVFRSFPLTSIHPNSIAASSAVEAAALQGYWQAYGDLLFSNQAEWFYATGTKRTNYFISYFNTLAGKDGDVEKFKADMSSSEVKAKIEFDTAIAKSLNINATPAFVGSDGKEIDWFEANTQEKFLNFFRNYIDSKLQD